jgi:chemotaxis protein CheD
MDNRECQRKVHIVQGQFHVTDDPGIVLSTVLGSCVAACIRDPTANVGGMNHFLLPGDKDRDLTREAERYGVHLMELLVNELLKRGARRERLEAKLFGGAQVVDGLTDIGAKNAEFAERFLRYEGIVFAGGSLGGACGRRIEFWPVSGRARQIFLSRSARDVPAPAMLPKPTGSGSVEFFS